MRRYILGFFTAAATAAALWLLHRTFPCPLTALLAPANGSPWEMGKLLFWPYLPAALVIWRLSPERGSRGGHCLLLAVMPLCMAGLCWLLPGRWLRLWSLVLAGGLTLHGTVLVDFWATWCDPCRMLAPILEELSGQHPELKIVKVDVDENRDLALQYGIESIPTLLVFKGGQMADRSVGLVSPQEILDLVK